MPPRKNSPAAAASPDADDSFDSVSADPIAQSEIAELNDQYAPNSAVEETNDLVSVVALSLINGVIQPGTVFTPASIEELRELRGLHAVRNLNDAEAALFNSQNAAE